jgi:ssDNA-binding Zn-finger/Zn-ribbon topoisomerase 1
MPGVGEECPKCGVTDGGTLVAKRGRFGPFVGCARYPECDFIKKDGPPPPDQLPFQVVCPTCGQGHLTARRARRTGSVFWGCSRYPKCDFTTSREPVGAVHDVDDGPIVRNGTNLATGGDQLVTAGPEVEPAAPAAKPVPTGPDTGICLHCGAAVPLPAVDLVGRKLPGGPADPTALRRPGRGGRSASRSKASGPRTGRTATRTARTGRTRGPATTGSAPGA